jgi:hypothetical protein
MLQEGKEYKREHSGSLNYAIWHHFEDLLISEFVVTLFSVAGENKTKYILSW